jgi:hypothetical protein
MSRQRQIGATATVWLVIIIILGRETGWAIRNWKSISDQGTWLVAWGAWLAKELVWFAQHLTSQVGKPA